MRSRVLLLLPLVAMLAACAGGPPPDPVVVSLPELSERERERLYDGRSSSPPLLDINRELGESTRLWESDDLTWIETAQG